MRKQIKKIAATALAVSMTVGLPAGIALAKGDVSRLGGSNRYETMTRIVSETDNECTYAVIARGDDFPDALAASALAGARNCPVILTGGSQLGTQAQYQLKRLKVSEVYVVGGTNAISDDVVATIEGLSEDMSVTRISGDSRVGTSVAILKEVRKINTGLRTVFIASGSSFADALAISPYAYKNKTPIVLADSNGALTDDAVAAIKGGNFDRAIVLGGDNAVDFATVSNQLGGFPVERLEGEDRYATANKIVEWELDKNMTIDNAAVATGQDFPDALAGSALCGTKNSVMILIDGNENANLQTIYDNAWRIRKLYILGGENAVSSQIKNYIEKNLDDSEYFVRSNPDGSNTRFQTVKVKVEGEVENTFELEIGQSKVILPKDGDEQELRVVYPAVNGTDIEKCAFKGKKASIKSVGKQLVVVDSNGTAHNVWISGSKDSEVGSVTITVDNNTNVYNPSQSPVNWLEDENAGKAGNKKDDWLS